MGLDCKSEKMFRFSLTVGNVGNAWQNIILAKKCIYDEGNCIPVFPSELQQF